MPQRSSEQLRREAEQSRAQVAGTLEELRARITPGQVVDQLVDYAGDSGAGEFFRNLGRQAVNNPLPVALMGAGLAWLMLGGKSPGTRSAREMMERGRGLASEAGDALGRWRSAAAATTGDLKNKAADWASDSAEAVRPGAERMTEKGKELGASISERARAARSGWKGSSPGIADESMALFGDPNAQISGAPDEAGSALGRMAGEAGRAYGGAAEKASSAYGAVAGKTASTYGAASDKAASAYEAAGDRAASAYGAASSKAASAYEAMSDRAAGAYGAVSDRAASAYDEASDAAARAAAIARERARAMRQSATDASRNLIDFCKDQPMVLAGLGLALGAAVGAMLPGAKMEDELMGETSDELKARAQALAEEQYERARGVAEHAYEETREAAEHAYEETKSAAQHAYEETKAAAENAYGDVREEAKAQGAAAASDVAHAAQENVPTAPTLPEGSETSESESTERHGQR